jgi:hypothetical protein
MAAAICAALGAAAPASAHVTTQTSGEVRAGPALTSQGAAFAARSRDGWRVKLLQPDGSVRVLHQFDSLGRRKRSFPRVAASPGRIVVAGERQTCFMLDEGLRDVECYATRIEYREAAPGDSTSTRLELCTRPTHDELLAYDVDVTDDAVAYVGCNESDANALVVRSLSDPAVEPFTVPAPDRSGFDAVRIAGRYVAAEVATTKEVVVYDRVARRELFRIGDTPEDRGAFALGDDGTVVMMPANGGPCPHVLSYTPAEPFAHPLPQRACSPVLGLSDGRIVLDSLQGLTVSELGGWPQVVAAKSAVDAWDLDARRVAYRDSTCTGAGDRLVISTFDELRGGGFRRPDTCPIRFARRRSVVERSGGVLAVRVACPRGCVALLKVDPVGRRPSRWWLDFRAGGGGVKTITGIRLFDRSDTPRTILRRRCAITLTSYQPDGTEKKVRIVRWLRFSKRA